ncbi:ribosomal maturation YjgA family protein [Glutamicibacter sp. AOP38-B1-38]
MHSLDSLTRRRIILGISACALVPLGLFLRFLPWGLVADLAGGVLYAALIYVVVAFIVPTRSWHTVGAWALGWCVAVELLQLTSLPREAAALFPPSRLILGTGFAAMDLLAYIVGALTAALADRAARRRT